MMTLAEIKAELDRAEIQRAKDNAQAVLFGLGQLVFIAAALLTALGFKG